MGTALSRMNAELDLQDADHHSDKKTYRSTEAMSQQGLNESFSGYNGRKMLLVTKLGEIATLQEEALWFSIDPPIY